MELLPKKNPTNGFTEPNIGSSLESFLRFLESQQELFHSQIDQLQKIVITQCKLTGANPLSQEMAAGALSIKIGKRPRDLLNPKAIKYMQSVFSIKDTISKKETREISALCGVTVTQVRDFFAGQRSRVRRLVRLSREKTIRFSACEASPEGSKASPNGIISNSDNVMPVSNPVPVNSVDPKTAEEGPSSSSQEENIPGIEDSDKTFLENIFNLMRKEETFSGQVKLMEWVLQIHNSAVLHWFLTKGGMMILATWLSQAALEEQTTVILIIFKVLCHLPLHKALPVHMSAILQTVNRLRFYRTSDISNRARVLLTRWSKLFVRSQALKKPSSVNSPSDAEKERIRKQRISEILSDESWQSKIDVPEEILALTNENSENSRKEPRRALKMLLASGEDSNKKHIRSGASPQTRERRKVLLVEQPGRNTAGRSMQVVRAASANQGRPMSADDIQKAKMRASFMQIKYGKIGTSSNENCQENTENQKTSSNPQTGNVPLQVSKTFQLKKVEDKKAIVLPSETSHAPPGTSMDSKPSMVPQEPFWEKLKRDQIPWQTPPEMRINNLWSVGAGEKSKEVEVQIVRIQREKETVYRSVRDIPPDPKEPWDVEMDFDDTLTPEIPTEQPPDIDGAEASPRISNNASDAPTVMPAPITTGNPEPDFELLAVLLKNPDLVFALTSGQGNSFTSAETVALLDMLKGSDISLPGILSGLERNAAEKPELTSLPSPTPPAERAMRWRSESAPIPKKLAFSQPVLPGNRFPAAAPTPTGSSVLHHIPTTNPSMPQLPGPENHLHVGPTTPQITGTTPLQKQSPGTVPAAHQLLPAASLQQIPQSSVQEAILPINHFPLTSMGQQNLLATGPSAQQIPTMQVEISNFRQIHNQKLPPPPPAAMLLNSSNDRPSSVQPLLPTTSRPSPSPLAFQPMYSPWPSNATGVGEQAPAPDSSISSRPRGFPDGRSSIERFPPNRSNYNAFPVDHMRAPLRPGPAMDRNEFMGEPEFEMWSPEGSPVRSPEFRYEQNFNGPRRDFGRNYRQEWPKHRNSGRRDHRSGNKRWRDRRH
ncbi:homeobox protein LUMINIDEPENDENS-like [Magnolia sinica]|uniref:homeobox protein LUMINIDEPENDENS-like n=1 Tax=Magnolia sinica TaxID=86752 RepID=UPI0026585C3F|nr:homeobox protein LUMINIDEPENDENS-like [Magnolia sinica]